MMDMSWFTGSDRLSAIPERRCVLRTLKACVVASAGLLAACSADATRLHIEPGSHDACRPGTFLGTMTVNCPQRVR